ncbi:MAG: hypothetical protein QUS07_07310 [Methanothrix sp.]|nr:hypothetical protein [Methanothrix sp.]
MVLDSGSIDPIEDERLRTLFSSIQVDYQVEVCQNFPEYGIYNSLEFEGFIRSAVSEVTESGRTKITLSGPGYADLLRRRIIAYFSGHPRTSFSGHGETILKDIVRQNLGEDALVAEGRFRAGTFPGLSIATDGATGSLWTGSRAYKNVLSVCQEVAAATEVDFDIVGTGPAEFEFRTYNGQRGTDRTTIGLNPSTGLNGAGNLPLIFSLERGNMTRPKYTFDRQEEVNLIYTSGQGVGYDRELVIVEDTPLQDDSPWNTCESQMDARNESSTDGLESAGGGKLADKIPEVVFKFDPLQLPTCTYGKDFFVGDKITAVYQGVEYHRKITGADVYLSTPTPSLNLYLATLPGRV